MTSTSRPPSSNVTIVDAIDLRRLRRAAPGASRSSARPTNTPTIRRRYQSLAMASVNGADSSAAAAAAMAIASASSARPDERALRLPRRGSDAGPTAPSAIRASATRSPSHVTRAATVDHRRRVRVLASELEVRRRLGPAPGPRSPTSSSSGASACRHEAGEERRPAGWSARRTGRRGVTVASSASRATATSPPGGGVNRLPPTVPMLRIDQLAVLRAASPSIGTASWPASRVSVVVAPIRSPPSDPVDPVEARPGAGPSPAPAARCPR